MKIRLLSKQDLGKVLSMRETIDVVEGGFSSAGAGGVATFPVVMERMPDSNGLFGIKSGYVPAQNALGLKMGVFWPRPSGSSIPGHFAAIFLVDGATGAPLAFMDGDLITNYRTGAASAVAAKYLARPESTAVGVIGGGVQGRMQVKALAEVFALSQIRIWSRSSDTVARYVRDMASDGFPIRPAENPYDAVAGADIVVTATPSTDVLVHADWVTPGTHVNAVGADARGKHEIDPALFQRAKVVVDDMGQCKRLGELQHPLQLGLIEEKDVHAELGQIVTGARPGRTSREEITLFDSTGVSFEDLVTARLAYERAVACGLGTDFDLG